MAFSESIIRQEATCNICGDRRFAPGPAERLSLGGVLPRCRGCGSLERHRVARRVIDDIRVPERFAQYRLIRFSSDPILDDAWFAQSELSVFGGVNSCDLHSIDRPSGIYDVILCSHVLEHVRDDAKAICELARILSSRGFLLIIVPGTGYGKETVDWGFPDPKRNFHYRGYGRNFDSRLAALVPDANVVAIEASDPVTGDKKRLHVLTRSTFWHQRFDGVRDLGVN
jgi:SAM-dependent methyltransferase